MSVGANGPVTIVLRGEGREPRRLGGGRRSNWWNHNTAVARHRIGSLGTVSNTGLLSIPLFVAAGYLLNAISYTFAIPTLHGMETAMLALAVWAVVHHQVLLPRARRAVGERVIVDDSGSAWALADAAASGALPETQVAMLLAVSEDAGPHRERIRQTALLAARAVTAAQGSPMDEQVRSTVAVTLEDYLVNPQALDQTARESFTELMQAGLRWRRTQRGLAVAEDPFASQAPEVQGPAAQIRGLARDVAAQLDGETARATEDAAVLQGTPSRPA